MDALLADYDPSYLSRSRRNSTSSSDGGSGHSPAPSIREIGKNIAGAAHHVHRHRRSRSRGSESINDGGEGSSTSGGASGLQERIFAKLMQQMLPSDYTLESYSEPRDRRNDKNRPQFALTTMSGNFRRFNAR